MNHFSTVFTLAVVVPLLFGRAPGVAASEALTPELVEMLLGEWVLEDTRNRVPTQDTPAGIFHMTGNTVNAMLFNLANSSDLSSKDNMELSDTLQRRVSRSDRIRTRSSSIVVVAANAVTGATVAYNVYRSPPFGERQKRLMGVATRTFDGEGAPVVQFTGGEQPFPADWTLRWMPDASGVWQMQAVRTQAFQLPPSRNTTRDVERQSVLVMAPFMKSNATLAELFPQIAGRFPGA